MAKLDLPAVWRDIKTYRRAYILTVVASFGGMVRSFTITYTFITDCPVAFWMGHWPDWWCPHNGCFPRIFRSRP